MCTNKKRISSGTGTVQELRKQYKSRSLCKKTKTVVNLKLKDLKEGKVNTDTKPEDKDQTIDE